MSETITVETQEFMIYRVIDQLFGPPKLVKIAQYWGETGFEDWLIKRVLRLRKPGEKILINFVNKKRELERGS